MVRDRIREPRRPGSAPTAPALATARAGARGTAPLARRTGSGSGEGPFLASSAGWTGPSAPSGPAVEEGRQAVAGAFRQGSVAAGGGGGSQEFPGRRRRLRQEPAGRRAIARVVGPSREFERGLISEPARRLVQSEERITRRGREPERQRVADPADRHRIAPVGGYVVLDPGLYGEGPQASAGPVAR